MIWRRLRDRFGITAPRVTVRTDMPWYWRVLGIVLALSVSVAFGAWLYDIARQAAGVGRTEGQGEVGALKARIGELESELAKHCTGSATGSALQIERTAQQQLARQVRALEESNGRLKEDLALFEKLASSGNNGPRLTINGLHVEPDAMPGQYRYRLLVVLQGSRKDGEFKGSLQVIVALQQAGERFIISFPSRNDPDPQRYLLNIRHFQRVDGTFQVPEGAHPISVEVRLIQDGATKASQSIRL